MAEISNNALHTLRHIFAIPLVNRGVDIVTVKELLGHSTVTVTMRYAHTNMDRKRGTVRNLAPDCYSFAGIYPKSVPRLKITTEKV